MNIAIIGAGPAGIISARNAIKAGHSVVLFEKNTRIGEIWRHCCKVSDEAAFCLIQRPYISKTLLT
ncbi:NAD(P)/FAD-dependent oxidoreductase, partial [Escherichia coli]|nr:NAD(P)/FAD-dependent oxidoreductase [Escherichia coli]